MKMDVEDIIIKYNKLYRKENPFSWYNLKCNITDFLIRVGEKNDK